MSSGRFAEVRTPLILSILMVLMTQVGYLDLMNTWSGDEETLDETTDALETGGSGSSNTLTPSVEGADLFLDVPMTNITFQYNASAASGSGSGSGGGVTTTYGNGSTWQVADINQAGVQGSGPGSCMEILVGDTIYFDATTTSGAALWAHDTSNASTWLVADIYSGSSNDGYGQYMHILVGDTIYFDAEDGSSGAELWAHDTSNASTWKVADINSGGGSNPGRYMEILVGDTIYFDANDGSSGYELWAHDTSNASTWRVADIRSGSGSSDLGKYMEILVGDTLYFSADHTNAVGMELWAHDTSNASTWRVADIRSGSGDSNPGWYMHILIGDTIYFSADDGSNGIELWAHDTSNASTWQVADINSGGDSSPGGYMEILVGDTIYFSADDGSSGYELWVHDTSNASTWQVADINSGSGASSPAISELVGDTLYFNADDGSSGKELWAHNTSNASTWQVADINSGSGASSPAILELVGDTLYFSANNVSWNTELWAHDTSNASTWEVADINSGYGSSAYSSEPGIYMKILVGDTLYFSARNVSWNTELWAHQPSEITSLGGGSGSGSSGGMTNVTGATCTVSTSLPTGLSIDSSTCTISGTPTAETSNTTYTVTANISNVTYQGSVWLSTSPYGTITSAVEGAALNLGEAMTPITLNYTVNANASSGSSGSSSSAHFVYANNKMSVGSKHTCAILDNGDLKCWGDDGYGQLGNGVGVLDRSTPFYGLVDLGTGRTAMAVSAGTYHTCAILDNGELKCWGRNDKGQIGTGVTGGLVQTPSSIDLGTGRSAVAVSAGFFHTCAVLDNGDLKCWGSDSFGRLGDGASTANNGILNAPSSTPVDLGTGRTAVSVSTSEYNTCAILDNGDLKCWGENGDGQLGLGSSGARDSPSSTPIDLGTGRTALDVSVAHDHVCAILDNGDMKCWGSDYYGQLGDGIANGGLAVSTNQPSSTPIDLGQGRTAVALNQGSRGLNTCAILDNGSMKCWGQELYGMLGNGGAQNQRLYAPSSTPIDFGTGRTVVAFDHSNSHTCAVLDNGSMMCWGLLGSNLGLGSYTGPNPTYPKPVAGTDVWDTTTTLATWETHPALPAGMSISGGTISGTPSVYANNQTYTIYANQSGYSTTHELYFSVDTDNAHTVVENQTIDPIGFHPPFNNGTTCWSVSPALPGNLSIDSSTGEITGSVNGTLTNTTYTVTANHGCTGSGTGGGSGSGTTTYGNGSTWNVTDLSSYPTIYTHIFMAVGDTIYFDADDGSHGRELWAHDTNNNSTWLVADINPGTDSGPGRRMIVLVGDTLYFDADGTNGRELWAHDTSNHSTWQVADLSIAASGWRDDGEPGVRMHTVVGDTLYFDAYNTTTGRELWAHDTSNHSTWLVADLVSSSGTGSDPGSLMSHSIGDTIYFDAVADSANGRELWAHSTTNGTTWLAADVSGGSSNPGSKLSVVIGDTLYFDAFNLTDYNIYAYNTVNHSAWQVADIATVASGTPNPIYDVLKASSNALYLSFDDGSTGEELWAFDFTNHSFWQVADIRSGGIGSYPSGGIFVDDTLYFSANDGTTGSEFWAHNEINGTTWQVADLASATHGDTNGQPGTFFMHLIGDTIYFDAKGVDPTTSTYVGDEVWAYDTSNQTWWPATSNSISGQYSGVSGPAVFIGDTLYYPARTGGPSGNHYNIYAHQPSEISPQSGGSGSGGSGSGGSTGTGATETFTFNLQSLADYDGDGLPNDLPADYDAAEGPTSGLVADADDDADGLLDTVETNTGTYVDSSNTGTDPLNPDTDGDGICDGPLAVPGVCIAGPDMDPNGVVPPPTLVALNNTAIATLAPYHTLSGGTYEIAPDLPASLSLNPTTGEITGTPTETTTNTTYTMWSNNSNGDSVSWDFTIEILEDSDGDGLPDQLPGDYDPSNPDSPGLIEDLDDDADGVLDTNETDAGTSPTNPDTDGDGMCDGPNAVGGVCTAGPDAFPLDPSADTDTDGDGQPDTINGNSTSVPPLTEDEDDDGDGLDDVNETGTGINNGPTDTGTDPLDPDTDNDGICDGPNAVPPICVAGPDATPVGEPAEGLIFGVNNSLFSSLVPPYQLPGAAWSVSPDLPEGLSIDPVSGIISGTPTEVIDNTTFTITGITDTSSITFDFNLQILEDTDGDGLPNELPEDYPEDGELVEDLDDDGDGASDLSETGTGIYNGTGDLGTDSLNPDTDGDGICDGPNAVPPVCLAGPDSNPVGTGPLGPSVLVNNTETTPINPPNAVPGATWEVSPDLPEGLVLDPTTGIITGTPTQAMDNTTYTIWANTTDPARSIEATFWLEILEDFDGDGMPDELPDDYPDTGVEPYTLIEDEDDDNDGMSDTNESIIGTDPYNPDTDGDGFCDGPGTGDGACYAGPDSHPLDPTLPVNTDGDAYPDEDPDGPGGLIADDDDDGDGYLDLIEVTCESDPLDATSIPDDMDGDGICDLMDDDVDGDGVPNEDEFGLPLDTSSTNPDTDGDGTCDGPEAPANGGCVAGPDAFPLDPAGAKDTDGDGKPDQLVPGVTSTSQPPLVGDLDDDDDTWSDADELACGTSSTVDAASVPADSDGDGICDALDPYLDLPFTLEYPTQYVDLFVNRTMEPLIPFVNGSGEIITWELEGELPEGLTFGWSPARDASLDGSIRGTPVNTSATVNLTVWANNSVYRESFSLSLTVFNDSDNDSLPDQLPEGYLGNLTEDTDDDNDGFSDSQEAECGSDPMDNMSGQENWLAICLSSGGDRPDDGVNWMWCFPCLLFLLLLLIIPLLIGRDRWMVMLSDGPEPEFTFAEPDFTAGSGTEDDPFILAPVGPLQPGAMESTVEEITITNMGDIKVDMFDFNDEENYGRFTMFESAFSMEGSRQLPVGKDGEMVINFKFDDREFPTYEGGTYTGRIKLGKASVYFLWEVTVMADERKAETVKKQTMDRIKKRKKSFDFERIGKATKKDADDLQAIKGIGPYSEEKLNALGIFTYEQLAHFDRETEDEVNDAIEHYKGRIRRDEWVKQAQDIIGAQAKADEEALKAAEEAQAKAEAEAKAAEEAEAAAKAAEEAEAAKKAEEEAAAVAAVAAAAAADKEAKEAEKKAKAEADKKAKEEAAAKKKAKAEAKKAEEDVKKAKAAEEKAAKAAAAAAEKKAKAEADEKAKEEAAAAAAAKKAEEEAKKAAAAKPANKEEKKKEELKRVKERSKSIDFKVLGKAKASDKDDLQVIKGIGPFIEEKLNALGIYTYLQISKMTSALEDQVNEAIEFFPGRVKRDQWVNQAKILLGEDVKLDEKALKQAEELERIAKKAEKIDFATLGVASASEKDDLKSIKGIGPFIEEKLNALGIFTFEQVSKMTAKIEEEVNVAIEFFPGRVKRDEWAKQAKQLHKDKN